MNARPFVGWRHRGYGRILVDETPLSASAVALNGRTVIDPDLFDLNHVEIVARSSGHPLRGPARWAERSSWSPISPKSGIRGGDGREGFSDDSRRHQRRREPDAEPAMGEVAALRTRDDRKIRQRLHRPHHRSPRAISIPDRAGRDTRGAAAVRLLVQRGECHDASVAKVVKGANLERFLSARAILLVQPSDSLSVTTTDVPAHRGRRLQQVRNPRAAIAPCISRMTKTSLTMTPSRWRASKLKYNISEPQPLRRRPAYWKRFVFQSTDSTEALQNINNLARSRSIPNFIQNLYVETDPTSRFAEELRLTSNATGKFQSVGGLYYSPSWTPVTSRTIGGPGFADRSDMRLRNVSVAGYCPASAVFPVNSV